ncbi:hypothetical protein [Chitinophaga varians]|uniref:hypothetical protein n=1 Tax=Chitinophaga varians TaxID=2202339 RepID=UPI00165F9F6C|nr:hypothetical protein [Chitinophaga varians]MBC9914171.1 hypothetical protein [Chitinophaga varians]
MALRKKHKVLIFVIALILVIIGLLYYYGFAIVLWMFTPPVSKLQPKEKHYIDSLRAVYSCQSIWREPRYFMNDTSRKEEYTIIMIFNKSPAGLETDSLKQDSLRKNAFKIARYAYLNVVEKSPKFPEYVVTFTYEDLFRDYRFAFKPKELEDTSDNHIGH